MFNPIMFLFVVTYLFRQPHVFFTPLEIELIAMVEMYHLSVIYLANMMMFHVFENNGFLQAFLQLFKQPVCFIICLHELWWPHFDISGLMVSKRNYPQMALFQLFSGEWIITIESEMSEKFPHFLAQRSTIYPVIPSHIPTTLW